MSETDERIREAANELARALSEGRRDYTVQAERTETTMIGDEEQKFAYTVYVVEHSQRRLSP